MLRRYRLGLALWLCSVGMVFVAFASAYVVRRGLPTYDLGSGAYSTDWQALDAPVWLLLINSLLLAAAALGMEIARRHDQRLAPQDGEGALSTARLLIVASLLLGSGFVAGQILVWRAMRGSGEFMTSGARPAFFYLLTGAHAVNVALGLVALIWIAIAAARWQRAKRSIAVDLAAWYFHAMTALWILLLCFLVLA